MRPFLVKLCGSMHAFELYDDGAEITDLSTAIDCAEDQFGKYWKEVYNGTVGADRSECIGGKLCKFDVDVDEAVYVGDGDVGVYYQTFQGGDGKWYMSALIDCNSASFCDYLIRGDGRYETEEQADQAGSDAAWNWCVCNGVEVSQYRDNIDEEGKERAHAILEAERVLQAVGCGGPDCSDGSAWYELVTESYAILNDKEKREFSDLHIVEDA